VLWTGTVLATLLNSRYLKPMDLLRNKCPKCHEGEIFRAIVIMNKSCRKCNYVFEREQGYFVGAMFLDAMFLPISAIPTVLFFAYNGLIKTGAFVAVFQMAFISPFVFRFSRLIWIQVGYKFDPPQ
jgi:hypothetical protein